MLQKLIESIRTRLGDTPEAAALIAEAEQAEKDAQAAPAPAPELKAEPAPAPAQAANPLAGLVEGEGDYHPPAARFSDARQEYDRNYLARKGLS